MLDVAIGSSVCTKQPSTVQILIEEMATNCCQWSSERNKPSKAARIYEVDALTTLGAQVEAITKGINRIQLPNNKLQS